MAPTHLLDTNIISDLVRNPRGRIRDSISAVGEDAVCTSIIVACELRFGVEKRGSERLARQLERILGVLPVLPFETPADQHYGELRSHLEAIGTPIGPNDLLIASHALALGLTVVTANSQEFARVPGLQVANWLD